MLLSLNFLVVMKRGLHFVSRIFVTANKLVEKVIVLLVFF